MGSSVGQVAPSHRQQEAGTKSVCLGMIPDTRAWDEGHRVECPLGPGAGPGLGLGQAWVLCDLVGDVP